MKKFYFLATTLLLISSLTSINVMAIPVLQPPDPDPTGTNSGSGVIIVIDDPIEPVIPSGTGWAVLDYLDTTGKTKELLPSYPIPYSAKWAEGEYGRIFSMSAEDVDSEFSYSIKTFGVEEEGTYTWDYTGVPASELPRNAKYKLYYVIKNGETVYDSQPSVASVTLLPEPSVILVLTVLGLSILRRK